jgi:hypothetical protein
MQVLKYKQVKVVYVPVIQIDGIDYDAQTLLDILIALADTDSIFNRILIHDFKIAKVLEDHDVARQHNKGSYWRGLGYTRFCKLIDFDPDLYC